MKAREAVDPKAAMLALRSSVRFSNELCRIMETNLPLRALNSSLVVTNLRQAISDMQAFVDQIDTGRAKAA
jgi:hypothetical protein